MLQCYSRQLISSSIVNQKKCRLSPVLFSAHTTAELLASLLPTLSSHNGTVIAVIYS